MSTRDELLQEIAESIAPRQVDRDAGWFTVNDIRELRPDVSVKSIREGLDKRADKCELEKSKAYDPLIKRVVNCYRELRA